MIIEGYEPSNDPMLTYPFGTEIHQPLREYLTAKEQELDREIAIKYCRGLEAVPEHDDKINILDYGAPQLPDPNDSGVPRSRTLRFLFYPVNLYDDGDERVLSQRGEFRLNIHNTVLKGVSRNFKVEEGGYVSGEITDATFWSYFSLANLDSYEKVRNYFDPVFARILDEDFFASHRRAEVELMGDRFATAMVEKKRVAADNLRAQVVNLESQLADLGRQERSIRQQAREIRRQIEVAEQADDQGTEEFKASLDILRNSSRFESVEFQPSEGPVRQRTSLGGSSDANIGKLIIDTPELYLYTPLKRERTKLGKFRINVQIGAGYISMINLTNPKHGRHHPHVNGDGHPCWGNAHATLSQMMQDGQIVEAVNLTMQYLESFNPPDDYGRYGTWWFENQEIEYKQPDGSYSTEEPVVEGEEETVAAETETPTTTTEEVPS